MKPVRIALVSFFALAALACGPGLSPEQLIVGKWEIPGSERSIEFTADGEVIMDLGEHEVRGEYKLTAEDRLFFRFPEQGILSRYRFSVTRDELILDDGAGPVVHRRVADETERP
jgi:hypothetical protein